MGLICEPDRLPGPLFPLSMGILAARGVGDQTKSGHTKWVLYQFAECLTLQGFPNHSQNDSTWQTEGFAMGQAIAVRTDYTSDEVRQLVVSRIFRTLGWLSGARP